MGCLIDLDDDTYRIATSCLQNEADELLLVCSYEVDPSTICQCTRLKDKNGNLIWENDVVRHYNNPSEPKQFEIGVIYWNEDNLRYERTSQYEHAKFGVLYDCVYEVIGNIFDNLELINE